MIYDRMSNEDPQSQSVPPDRRQLGVSVSPLERSHRGLRNPHTSTDLALRQILLVTQGDQTAQQAVIGIDKLQGKLLHRVSRVDAQQVIEVVTHRCPSLPDAYQL